MNNNSSIYLRRTLFKIAIISLIIYIHITSLISTNTTQNYMYNKIMNIS